MNAIGIHIVKSEVKLRETFYKSKEMNECIFILNECYALKRRKHFESKKNEAKHIRGTPSNGKNVFDVSHSEQVI